MSYIENPKTKGSGILCCIPQTGTCPNECEDCFFQSGRSYLEPLEDNLPNIPQNNRQFNVIRVNDGNDSNIGRNKVFKETSRFPMKFFNTSIPELDAFDDPVVLTINPSKMTDKSFHRIWAKNLMFVRFRANLWNLDLAKIAVQYYADREVPIIMTFMAYFKDAVRASHISWYVYKKRTLNSYWVITTSAWRKFMATWEGSPWEKWVYTCGKIEGELGAHACRHCGNCLREYFATMERLIGD
ncbi:hypothetical protein LCGC14_3168830 [marine sediment metagenome]|uniref:Uncharacterized protein n=1 Tax=marine sediment metagenome TaxID=412755 RepID=A0A0F8VFA9_9ZZZZ